MEPMDSEYSEEKLTQIIAVLLQKLGGEAIITQQEFDTLEGLPVLGSHLSSDRVKLRLGDFQVCDCCGESIEE